MSNRGKRINREVGNFLKSYQRKAQRGVEPNDRHYDRDMEKKVKRLEPKILSELMHGDLVSGVTREIEDRFFTGGSIDGIAFRLNDSVTIIEGLYAGYKPLFLCSQLIKAVLTYFFTFPEVFSYNRLISYVNICGSSFYS